MSYKLMFEIGHSASRKTKPSKEGFTHDWELFVRGGHEGNDISHFVEKVVFNLHDSFPKPKRVIKEPPYTVKEAGYAGFLLTIDIYLKNRDEPKKLTFEYDLDLQPFKTQMNEFIVPTPSEEFKRKCVKGGCVPVSSSDYKNRDPYKNPVLPSIIDQKKIPKRPEEAKPNKAFTDLFGAPLKKPDPRSIIQNSSPNPTKGPPATAVKVEKIPMLSASKEKGEKSKHKHSPNKDGKESKKSESKTEPEKSKKDKTKDRERSDKKEKVSKRPSSPSPNSMPPTSSSSARNSTNLNALPQSKSDAIKPSSKQSSTPIPPIEAFVKKSSKKDKKSDKDRDRTEKKEPSRSKDTLPSKDKFESAKSVKDRGDPPPPQLAPPSKDDRDKIKAKATNTEPKTTSVDVMKKPHEKETERKSKHKKKEKTKDKDVVKDSKKEKQHKNSPVVPLPAKSKEPVMIKYEATSKVHLSDKDSSDSDADSPPSIKQDSDNSISDTIVQKHPPEAEKTLKKPRDRTKADKENKSRKRKSNKKDERDSSASPPPLKLPRKDLSKSPMLNDRPSSSDSAAHHSHSNINNNNNNNTVDGGTKMSNDYMSELKDLKQKITTLKNNEDLQQVVRLIAATGCYEITKSSFDFDLVQLDRGTVQRLQEFFATS